MAGDLRRRLRRIEKAAGLSLVLGISVGYVVFYGVFPSSSVPVSGDASFAWILCVLVGAALVVGFAAEDIPLAMLSAFLSVPVALVVSTAMGLSPALAGLYVVEPSEVPFFLLHYGLAIFALGFLVNVVVTLVGCALRERFLRRVYRRSLSGTASRK